MGIAVQPLGLMLQRIQSLPPATRARLVSVELGPLLSSVVGSLGSPTFIHQRAALVTPRLPVFQPEVLQQNPVAWFKQV